jgi:hypothetical protein
MPPPQGLLLPFVDPTTIANPAANTASLVVNLSGQLTVITPGPIITPILNPVSLHDSANSAGNTTVTPTGVIHSETIAVSGTAGIRQVLVSTVGLGASSSGNRCRILFTFAGQPPGIIMQIYSSNSAGPLLGTITTDGTQNTGLIDLKYDNSIGQWVADLSKEPATN